MPRHALGSELATKLGTTYTGAAGRHVLDSEMPSPTGVTGRHALSTEVAAIVVGPTTIVSDSFNRADSTTTLGSANTGQAWTVLTAAGVWGISSNQAYTPVSKAQCGAVVESGVADCTVSVTLSATADAGLVFRATDDNNYTEVGLTGAYRRVAGTFTNVATYTTFATGDVMTAVLSGTSVRILKNGTQVATYTATTNLTATKHGLRCNGSTAARFDNFLVTVP